MANNKYPSGLKVPVRPAPAPPPPLGLSDVQPSQNLMAGWESFEDSFGNSIPSHVSNQVNAWPHYKNLKKKVPPPRPPPPKVLSSKLPGKSGFKQGSKANPKQQPSHQRPTELLSNLFTRRGHRTEIAQVSSFGGANNKTVTSSLTPVATASLIDLSSPPSSPTPTTRSSSDGLSVDSFGSDGTASHSHHHSQVESGFEDDSDLFGGFTATPSPVNHDPWASSSSTPSDVFSPFSSSSVSQKNSWCNTPQDPFSPPRKFNSSPTHAPTLLSPPSNQIPGAVAFKPTIIRPKLKPNSSPSVSRAKSAASPLSTSIYDAEDRSESPPMPSIPPPAPPAVLFSDIDTFSSSMGSLSLAEPKTQGPHCIALYDYESSHPDDLVFKEGDVIELVDGVCGEWLRGCIKSKVGLFPANFVKVVVPPIGTGGISATALYAFTPETWEDLELQEGAQVLLLSRINSDWLYGQCNGKRGQFPSTFVDHVPSNLPTHS